MVENLIRLINSMEQVNFKLSVHILLRIFRNFSHDYPNSPVSIQMLEGMNNLSIHCEERFDKDLWKAYINVT
jgi:hypothetical protein